MKQDVVGDSSEQSGRVRLPLWLIGYVHRSSGKCPRVFCHRRCICSTYTLHSMTYAFSKVNVTSIHHTTKVGVLCYIKPSSIHSCCYALNVAPTSSSRCPASFQKQSTQRLTRHLPTTSTSETQWILFSFNCPAPLKYWTSSFYTSLPSYFSLF